MINTAMHLPELYNNPNLLTDSTYLIKIDMVDGSSQLIQITKEQAVALGIEFTETVVDNTTAADVVNVDQDTHAINVNNIGIADSKTKYNYKIIQPEDLNLTPSNEVPALVAISRGRPKKRPSEDCAEKQTKPVCSLLKAKKPARTRSGRITRPPVHMEKDFAKIVINEDRCEHSDQKELSTTEFKPLKTNQAPVAEFTSLPEAKVKKKKKIPGQYRCSKCLKAYLGRNRMAMHLKKHPDHGSSASLLQDSDTWSCLIDSALKAKEGQKGTRFCKEIINLVRNVRVLVKYFFKPTTEDKSEYCVDAFLSSVLNVKEGYYRFNENDLCKDISIFSLLEYIDDSFTDHVIKYDNESDKTARVSNGLELNERNNSNEANINHETNNINLQFDTDILDLIEDATPIKANDLKEFNTEPSKHSDELNVILNSIDNQKSKSFNEPFDCVDMYMSNKKTTEVNGVDVNKAINTTKGDHNITKSENEFNLFSENKNFTNTFTSLKVEKQSKPQDTFDSNPMNKIKTTEPNYSTFLNDKTFSSTENNKCGKEIDIFRSTINNILSIGTSNENKTNAKLPGDLLELESSQTSVFRELMDHHISKESIKNAKKPDEFDFNKILSADISDELILPDTAQVGNMLDTSTSSDDIMNVDQFVNERFKKLTEVDVDMQNPTLNLDLPSLDCFNFHTD